MVENKNLFEKIEELKVMLKDVSNQVQELREAVGESSNKNEELSVRELYEHPWDKHIRERSLVN